MSRHPLAQVYTCLSLLDPEQTERDIRKTVMLNYIHYGDAIGLISRFNLPRHFSGAYRWTPEQRMSRLMHVLKWVGVWEMGADCID